MNSGEIYTLKRLNFIEKTKKNFEFLVSELKFNQPEHIENKQSNGVIIQDQIEYDRIDKKITILNAYHPVDYGFEINLTNKENGKTEMLHSVLKENQDMAQSYLKSASHHLKTTFWTKLK